MKAGKTLILGAVAAVLLLAGIFLSLQRASEQADLGGGTVFPDLKTALADIQEIRLAKGDGSRTTLRKEAAGWTVVERQFPADALRVREFALAMSNLRVVERKTADPANYAKLGVENPDTPTAASTLVEVVAGKKTWSLIVGKGADNRAVYLRKPGEAASFLATPLLTADPDQKRWIDRLIVDLPAKQVREIAAKVGKGPAYLLSRAEPEAADLKLSPVPRGRVAASTMSLSGQAEALASFHFDDLRGAPAAPGADTVTYRTFGGQEMTFTGRREGDKAFITVSANPRPGDQLIERILARAQGVEFEIPVYKYEAIFRPYDDLLEKPAGK